MAVRSVTFPMAMGACNGDFANVAVGCAWRLGQASLGGIDQPAIAPEISHSSESPAPPQVDKRPMPHSPNHTPGLYWADGCRCSRSVSRR